MKEITPYIHRDITWLDFNYRVLQEAMDHSVPLMDRLKFLAIYSSNLEEFFKVRVANNRNLHRIGKKTRKTLGFAPAEILKQVLKIVNEQQLEFSNIFFNQIVPELAENGIRIKRRQELTLEQKEYVENFFTDELLPYVQPVLLVEDKIKPFLNNGSLYLAMQIEDLISKEEHYAIVKVPSDQMKRFILLPSAHSKNHDIILIDDVVRHCVPWLFPGFHIKQSYSIKLTRDADLYIDDEFSGDLIKKIRSSLIKRNVGPASRLVYDRSMPREFLKYLQKAFDLTEYDLLPEGRYHNNFDFFKFPSFDNKHLSEASLEPISIPELEGSSLFDNISKRDYLIHPPYHSYESVIKFFELAAIDPDVTHIKIVQYRVAAKSRIMRALIRAARNGKQVTVFVEVKARFDEEANLEWGERLELAGVQVHYSIPGIKVHAKMASIIRHENGSPKIYSHFSTGNFHEKTANVYSDIGIFTTDERLTKESIKVFNYLETKNGKGIAFNHLLVGMFNLVDTLKKLIDHEIENAHAGKKASIILKMNSIQDPAMIDYLYHAANEGVQIKLIIRGICSIVPKMPGISDGIKGLGIVDRFLEHARVFIFHNDGDRRYFISSADWMYRNLYKRIEVVTPIYDVKIQNHIQNLVDIQLSDNVKARSLNYLKVNKYIQEKDKLQIRSQIESYLYIKRNQ